MATVSNLRSLIFFTLTLIAHANSTLNSTDHHSLTTILNDLTLSGDLRLPENPCNFAGIFCRRRMINSSYNVKATGIVFKAQRLNGFLSPEIGELSELKELSLPENYITDRIPPEIGNCRRIEVINLQKNRFSGVIPVELSHLVRLRVLDLSYNQFSGDLGFLKHFPNLEILSLENNMFTGKVPVALRSFRNLRLFNVSGNSLIEYPSSELKKSSSKRYIFAESTNSSRSLTGTEAPAPAPAPEEYPNEKDKKQSNRKKIIACVIGFFGGSFGGFLSATIVSVMIKLISDAIINRRNQPGPSIFTQSIKTEDLAFLDDDDAIAALTVIGRGGCGEVYKTDIPNGKIKTIAIKKITQPPKDAEELSGEDTKMLNKKMRQIRSEIQTVGRIRHRNLVSLLAHVSRPTCHYLVYEFMKNGSLQDILQQVQDGSRQLEWLARHKIAVGVASGLEYLHTSHTPRIVHRDLKPANVLLDDDMEARIADFGLAKSIPEADTHVSSSNVAGTLGYIAPEYHQTMKFTDKCDIYSFGVLLGVLVMGKLPSDDFFQHTAEVNLVKWMRKVMTSDNPKEAIDPSLLGNGYEEQMLLVLKIACFCTLDNPKERPNSKDCRCMLAQIEH